METATILRYLECVSDFNKILIVRFSSVGDVVLASPAIRLLRARFPEAQIDFVTRKEYAPLLRHNHNLNFTFEYDAATEFSGLQELKRRLRAEQYDLTVDLHNSLRSRYLRSVRGVETATIDKRIYERTMLVKFKNNLYKEIVTVADRYIEPLKKFGIANDGKGLELHIPDEVLFEVSGKISTLQLNRFERVLGICPFAKHLTKRWPLERFAETAVQFIRTYDGKVLVFGGPADAEANEKLVAWITAETPEEYVTSFIGKFSLLESAAAMEYCDAILTNDTGLMHIAAAMKKQVVAVFGSTVREFGFFPPAESSIVLEVSGLECRPCSHIGLDECPKGHFRCMSDISIEQTMESISQILNSK